MAGFVQRKCADCKASPRCSALRSLCGLQLVACSLYTMVPTLHRAVPVFRDQAPLLLPGLPIRSSRCAYSSTAILYCVLLGVLTLRSTSSRACMQYWPGFQSSLLTAQLSRLANEYRSGELQVCWERLHTVHTIALEGRRRPCIGAYLPDGH